MSRKKPEAELEEAKVEEAQAVPENQEDSSREEPEPEAKKEEAKAPKQLAITARQFTKARGLRWERSAGFLHFAGVKYGKSCRKTSAEWTEIWEAWWRQPAEQPVKKEV